MLENIQTLPGAECKLAVDDWDRFTAMGERRSNVRRHIVRSFCRVPVSGSALRDETFKEVSQIEHNIRISILLDHERTGGVLNENSQLPARDALFGKPIRDGPRERIQAFAAGLNGNRRVKKSHSTVTLFARLRG